VLADAQDRGFIGGDLEAHLEHSLRFQSAAARGAFSPRRAVDLGSGGGIPGLVLASMMEETSWFLVDSQLRRTDWLREAVGRLGLGERVEVVHRRAEDLGRDPRFRSVNDLVVSRSFGPPAVVAECGAPLLVVGGRLVVSEPQPSRDDRFEHLSRWASDPLRQLGLVRQEASDARFAVLEQVRPCPERFPRRPGVPSRKPLF
jgi:16S rRNA (guanine527-N7)-methyltransferase